MFGLVRRSIGGRAHWPLAAAGLFVLLACAGSAQAAPYAYVANIDGEGPSNVSQFNVGAGGLLAPLSPPTVGAGSGPDGVALSPDGKSVYVTNLNDNTISQYDVGAGGALSPKSPPTVGADDGPEGLAVSPNGKNVYVAASFSDRILHENITVYDVNPTTGALSARGNVRSHGDTPHSVAVSPDGKSLYATQCCTDNAVAQFDITSNGGLVSKIPATVHVDAMTAAGVAVSPDGKSVYVVNSGGFVNQFNVGAGGRLSPKNPSQVPSGGGSQGIAVTPDGKSLYVTTTGVDQFDIGAAGGRLSPKSPATVAAGSDPFGIAVNPLGGPASVSVSGKTLVIVAGLGHRDNIAVTRPLPGSLRVTNLASGAYTGSNLVAGAGCTLIDSRTAKCNAATGVNRIRATARDLGDRIVNSTGIQSSLYGEKGNDVLVGGTNVDVLTGGPDPDVIKGMNGNDQLFARDLTSDTTINCDGGNAPGPADRADLDLLPKDPNSKVTGCESKKRH